jgi:hypothetical protein
VPKRIAIWNATAGVWETTESLLCGHSALFSETWPSWGSMRGGVAYALPTPAPPTDGSGSSSLPTPTANMMTGPGSSGRDGGDNLQTAVSLLPPPTTRDWKDGPPTDAVPVNALLGRAVWALGPE